MSELVNELGEVVLPGMEGPWKYQQPRGHGSGQTSSQSEDWYTHSEVVELVRELYGGTIDLDPMSCAEANEVVQAERYYTAEEDGLVQSWYGHMLWNPPWGGSDASAVKKRGLKKLMWFYQIGHVKECVCILNANAMTTRWFAPLLNFPVCIPPRRIAHYGPGGKGGSPNSGTVIVYVGPSTERFSYTFRKLGRIMVPYGGMSEEAISKGEDYE